MVQLDWKRILTCDPDLLSEEEKDDLFNSVAWFEIEPNLDSDRLRTVLKVSQEILKYKGEQVESLVVELDNLAARQGSEEARRHQKLIEELEDLREQVSHSQIKRKSSTREGLKNEDLLQELAQSELNNEQLLTELKAREREVLAEKREVEKYAAQVVSLEREKSELKRELAAVQIETSSQQETLHYQDSPSGPTVEKQLELTKSISQKNKHISQLLNDVELVEKENLVLREKLSSLRDELGEATKHLTHMTGELMGLKQTCVNQEEKINQVGEQNNALRSQVKELVRQKQLRDSQLDDFSDALDSRVQDWKKLTEEKDAEIEELNARLSHLTAQAPNIQIDTERGRVAILMQTLQKREEQIEDLQKKLSEATKEILNSASVIENIKSKKSKRKTVDVNVKLQTQLQLAEEQVNLLKNKINDAEEDARVKAEEMTDMIIQLREYESGEYGLMEAVGEIKELRQQVRVRDKQIEELIQASNKLQADIGLLDDQNLALRDKLGMSADAQVSIEGVTTRRQKDQALMRLLQDQAERLEEDKLQLKLENRTLRQQVQRLCQQVQTLGLEPDFKITEMDASGSRSKVRSIELERIVERDDNKVGEMCGELEDKRQRVIYLEEKFQEVLKENESLRKGMHEILDSIHNQDGNSLVQLESQCLERLLEALDSRHVSGWYHPAMRLQGQLQGVEGSNAVLREQLREARSVENEAVQQLQKAKAKIKQLENTLSALRENSKNNTFHGDVFEEMVLPKDLSLSSAEIISKLNMHLLHVLHENNSKAERNKIMEKNIDELGKKFNIAKHQMGLLYKDFGTERDEWKKTEALLLQEKENFEMTIESLLAKVRELETHWDVLDKSEDEQKKLLSESAKKTAMAASNEVVALRKCKALQNMENQLRKENTKLKESMSSTECTFTQKIGELKRQKEMAKFKIRDLQQILDDSVPLTKLEAANREFNELTSKYRDMLQKEQSLVCDSKITSRLEQEVDILCKDKEELSSALQEAREKLHSLEVLVMSLNQDTVTQDTHDNQISLLTKRLATVEIRELNEKQRADHADKLYQLLKGQLTEVEERNVVILDQNKMVVKHNLELQQIERELRDNLLTFVSRDELREVESKLRESETHQVELKLERDRLREMIDIAQEQLQTLELVKTSQDCEVDFLKQLVLNLQSASDEKIIIARVSNELLSARLTEASVIKKVQQLQNEVLHLQSVVLKQEAMLEEKEKDFDHQRNLLTNRCQSLQEAVQSLRQQYSGSVPLAKFERFAVRVRQLGDDRRSVRKELKEAEDMANEVNTKKEMLELERRELQELKQMLTIDSLPVVDWHSKSMELKLLELQARKKVELLEVQLQQAEERICKQEDYVTALEKEVIYEERNIDQMKSITEDTQTPAQPVKSEPKAPVEKSPTPLSSVSQAANVVLVSNQSEKLFKCESELGQLRGQLLALSQQMQEKDNLLLAKDKVIAEIGRNLAKTKQIQQIKEVRVEEKLVESTGKLALQATVDNLESIVRQKEDTISRYQQLIKEARDEHSRAAAHFQEELRNLQTALTNQQQANNKLKNKVRQASRESKPTVSTIEQYISRMHELEDEVAELNTLIGNLTNQLHSCRGEADRWRSVADDRLNNMGELRQKLEEHHRAELQSYQDEAQRYRFEAEALRGPMTLLKAQMQEREERIRVLSQTVADLKTELAAQAEARTVNSVNQTKTVDEIQTLKKQLKLSNERLKFVKDELHELQVKSREVWLKKKEEIKAEKEEMLQNKIKTMEKVLKEEKSKLESEMSENIVKRIKSAEEVARWEEKKNWQKTVEKLKEKLAEKTKEEDKSIKTEKSLRDTIARLDREKIALSNRSSKGSGAMESRIEMLESEKGRLVEEVASLKNKLESQKHHSGGLGAAMLEERLEAQQRQITVLELAKKGKSVMTDEFERLQETNAVLKKANLRLESENLELRLDFEKLRTDTPGLKEKVSHLEKYIARLQQENGSSLGSSESGDVTKTPEKKSIAELQKTVNVLKRVVQKLQLENKQLKASSQDHTSDKRAPVDCLKSELASLEAEKKKLQEHYLMAMETTTQLEAELNKARFNNTSLEAKLSTASTESEVMKTQLVQKTELLDRVKGLLQRAAAKEKLLNEQVSKLRRLVPADSLETFSFQNNLAGR